MYTYDDTLFSDLHKDAYGFRPNSLASAEWNSAAPAQKQVLWDELVEALDRAIDEEAAQHEASVNAFEARVSELISIGAGNRETAVRWIVESLNLSDVDKMYGGSYICHLMGLPYSMSSTFEAIN